jgi:DNA-binding response OmpR family regulator
VSQPTVLVVDDDMPILLLMRSVLREFGFSVATASSGEEALSVVRSEKPALVLVDMNMPGMSGLDVIRALRAEFDRLPILILSGHPVSKSELERFQADGAVQKPFDLPALIAQIRAHLPQH